MDLDAKGEDDPTQLFFADGKSSTWLDRTLIIDLSRDGVINTGDSTAKDKKVEIGIKAISTTTAIVASAVGAAIKTISIPEPSKNALR